jgi:sugar lactone lactonase YvrE
MKHLLCALPITGVLLMTACSKENINAEQQRSTSSAALLKQNPTTQPINFTEENLFPEGVVYDPFNNRFYVSSVTRGDIGIVTPDGSYTPFITDPVLTSTTGLEIDKARKRLYVSNAPNGVGAYDINSGNQVFYADLAALIPGAPVFINDIALDPQGNAYATNSAFPVIYKITPGGQASIFLYEPLLALPAGQFGFNGIEYSTNGFLLVAYSAKNMILKFPVSDPASYTTVMLHATLSSPDGLLLSNNGKELTVVNNAGGGEGRVMTFTSKNKWQSGMLTSSFNTGPVFPTTATTDGKNVYVLYAYLHLMATGRSTFTIQPVP